MFDDSKRLDALEAGLAELRKGADAAAETNAKGFKEMAEKRQSLVDQLNKFTDDLEKIIVGLRKVDDELDAAVKKLTQRVATVEADVKKIRK